MTSANIVSASAALLLSLACSGDFGDSRTTARADSGEAGVKVSMMRPNPSPSAEMEAGDVRIVTMDSAIDLSFVGDSISSGLSAASLAKVRRDTDSSAVSGTGMGADIERMVKGTVRSAVATRVGFPISAVRDVHFDGRAIVFDWVGSPPKIFTQTKVNQRPLLESFRPDDARRFAEAVHARKRDGGNY